MGYIGYRRSEKLKKLDLRLELRKAENLLRSTAGDLPSLLERAKASRTAVLAARGLSESGNMELWLSDLAIDFGTTKSLGTQLPNANVEYTHVDSSELETKLVVVHALQLQATQIQEKYSASLAADDRDREQIRADQRVVTSSQTRHTSS
jgi:hypothetical protein